MQSNLIVTLAGVDCGILILVDDYGVGLFEVIHKVSFEDEGVPVTMFSSFPTLEADHIVIDAVQWLRTEAKGCLECSLLSLPQELMHLMWGLDHFCVPVNNVVPFSK